MKSSRELKRVPLPNITSIVTSPFSSQFIVLSDAKITGFDFKSLLDEEDGLNIMEEEKTKQVE